MFWFWLPPNPPEDLVDEEGLFTFCSALRESLFISCICLRSWALSIFCCLCNILSCWRKSGIRGCWKTGARAEFPTGWAVGRRVFEWRIAPVWVPRSEMGIEVSCLALFPGTNPLRLLTSISLFIAGPDPFTKRRVCWSKTAGACGCTSQLPRIVLCEKTLPGAVPIRRTRSAAPPPVPVAVTVVERSTAGPGNRRLRVSGTVGESTRRPSKGWTRITSPGDIGRPPWNVLLLTATEQFCPLGQFTGAPKLPP